MKILPATDTVLRRQEAHTGSLPCMHLRKTDIVLHHLKTLEGKNLYLSPALILLEYLSLMLFLYEELKHID